MISSVVIKVQQKPLRGQVKIVWLLLPNEPFPGECQAEFVSLFKHWLSIYYLRDPALNWRWVIICPF